LATLRQHVRRRVILMWDRLPAHRSRVVKAALAQHRSWLTVVWLPAYAPDLNPVEQLWAHLEATALATRRSAGVAAQRPQRAPSGPPTSRAGPGLSETHRPFLMREL